MDPWGPGPSQGGGVQLGGGGGGGTIVGHGRGISLSQGALHAAGDPAARTAAAPAHGAPLGDGAEQRGAVHGHGPRPAADI